MAAARAVAALAAAQPRGAAAWADACDVLNVALADGRAAAAEAACTAGGAEAVTAGMRAHAAHAPAQLAGCEALARMCVDAMDTAPGRAIAAGALPACVAALRTLMSASAGAASADAAADAAADASTALGALHNMLFSAAGATRAAYRAGRDAGAVEAALAALERHGTGAGADAALFHRGFDVVFVLADDATVACTAAAGDSRVVRLAVAALRHPAARASSAAVQAACHALNTYTAPPSVAAHHAAAYEAGALDALVGVLRAHAGDADVARIACCAAHFLVQQAPGRAAAHAADEALLGAAAAAVLAHLRDARVVQHGCATLTHGVQAARGGAATRASQDAAGAAGAVEAACAALCREADGRDEGDDPALLYAASALRALLRGGHAANGRRALAATADEGKLFAAVASSPRTLPLAEELRTLWAAACAAHDAAPRCAAGARCARCAAHVAAGALCACPGCDARRRPDGRALARCGACRGVAYCGAEHQREHWAAHKGVCGAARRGAR
jgi:hypothetical protein